MSHHNTAALNDFQVALLTQRGTATTLTLFQEDAMDSESGGYQPAKAMSITDLDSIRQLRNFLNGLEILN